MRNLWQRAVVCDPRPHASAREPEVYGARESGITVPRDSRMARRHWGQAALGGADGGSESRLRVQYLTNDIDTQIRSADRCSAYVVHRIQILLGHAWSWFRRQAEPLTHRTQSVYRHRGNLLVKHGAQAQSISTGHVRFWPKADAM